MDRKLQQWSQVIRDQHCPAQVIEAVEHRMQRKKVNQTSEGSWGDSILVAAMALIMTTLIIAQWNPTSFPVTPETEFTGRTTYSNEKAVEEVQLSLAMIGEVMMLAGQKTSQALVEDTHGPLSKSYQTFQNILSNFQYPSE